MLKLFITAMFTLNLAYALHVPKTIKADFTQTVTNEHDQTIKYSGKIYVQMPHDSKWVYTKPAPKSICVSKQSITIVERDLEQATIYNNQSHLNFNNLLNDAKEISSEHYETTFEGITYSLQTKEEKIHFLEFVDELQNRSQIEFSNVSYDTKLPSLECDIPPYYDIYKD
ncbi:MAG: LolA-like outer membrane lipoprotein chaperone [Campylobacterota bacterium]